MATKVQIISNAVALLGHKPVITLDAEDADDLVITAEQSFDYKLPACLAQNSWRFATRITQLSLVNNETPPTWWKTVWQLPSGYLKNIRLYPQNYAYEIYENLKIYAQWSTESAVFMEHIFQPDVTLLPAWFVDYFVYELAAYLALSNAQKTEFYSVLEQKRTLQLAIAMGIDAQNRPNRHQVDFPMLNIVRDNFYNDGE